VPVSGTQKGTAGQEGAGWAAAVPRHPIKSISRLQTSSGDSAAEGVQGAAPSLGGFCPAQPGPAQGGGEMLGLSAWHGGTGTVTPMTPTAVAAAGLDLLRSDSVWLSPARIVSTSLIREPLD